MSKKKPVGVAPEDSSKWKCNWLGCEGGMGLAGMGCCSFQGDWRKKNCKRFRPTREYQRLCYIYRVYANLFCKLINFKIQLLKKGIKAYKIKSEA